MNLALLTLVAIGSIKSLIKDELRVDY